MISELFFGAIQDTCFYLRDWNMDFWWMKRGSISKIISLEGKRFHLVRSLWNRFGRLAHFSIGWKLTGVILRFGATIFRASNDGTEPKSDRSICWQDGHKKQVVCLFNLWPSVQILEHRLQGNSGQLNHLNVINAISCFVIIMAQAKLCRVRLIVCCRFLYLLVWLWYPC